MKKNESVTHIMTASPIAVSLNLPVSAARRALEDADIHHLPVTDGDQLVGILTTGDLLRVSFGDYGNQDSRSLDAILDHTFQLKDLMTSAPVSIDQGQTIREAAQTLVHGGFHSLPVVDNGKLVGIVTSTDLIKYLVEQY